ncbi:MAG TPA: hypothetical protein VFR85_07115 [Anaeromyxobacteraceae bacterium]|nr:hypothetical protein [Anaeromyxobacteraceae bacterium]
MQGLAALLVLALDVGSASAPAAWLRQSAVRAAAGVAVQPAPLAAPAGVDKGDGPPPCAGDVCEPQVAVPGYEPQFSIRGARTQLALQALDAVQLEPVATAAWWLAATGVRLDYTPAAMDAAANGGGEGVAHFQVLFRWRIDAFGRPAWLERRR